MDDRRRAGVSGEFHAKLDTRRMKSPFLPGLRSEGIQEGRRIANVNFFPAEGHFAERTIPSSL
jgi:hypothetical protein